MHIFIHIGYPKTGSSAIQSHIFSNQGWFRQHGIHIPATGFSSNLGHAFLLAAGVPFFAREESKFPSNAEQLVLLNRELEDCARAGIDRVLISWEGFAMLREEAIAELAEALSDHHVTLLAYVRDQISLYQSAALQGLQDGWYSAPGAFFGNNRVLPSHLEKYDFTAGLSRWQRASGGRFNQRIRIYDKSLLADEDVIVDFLNWLGLEPDQQFAFQSRAINSSLDDRAAAVLLIARHLGVPAHKLNTLTRALTHTSLDNGGGSSDFLLAEDRRRIREFFQDSNEQLWREFKPENASPDASELFPGSEQHGHPSPMFDYLQSLFHALQAPQLPVWEGEPLHAEKLAELTDSPNTGWRGAEPTGVWSVGTTSSLAFHLPTTDASTGPRSILLQLKGHYYAEPTRTAVTLSGQTQLRDLSDVEIRIDIDEKVRRAGVSLHLGHQHEGEAPEGMAPGERLGYKLQTAAYSFVW